MRETAQATRAFSDYLAQAPPRSLERLAQSYRHQTAPQAPPPTRRIETLRAWSRAHAWQDRVRAHEQMLSEEVARAEAEKRKQAREARLGIAAQVMTTAYREFMQKAQEGRLTPYAALQALALAFDTQRKDLGEPDERIELGGPNGEAIVVRVIYEHPERDV